MMSETEEDYKRKEDKPSGLSMETFKLLYPNFYKCTILNAHSLDMTPEEFEEQRKKNARANRALEMGGSEVLTDI